MRLAPLVVAIACAGAADAATLQPGQPPNGQPAYLALEIDPGPGEALSGPLKKGAFVARHTVRAAGAAVLLAEAPAKQKKIPSGAALAEVRFAPDLDGLLKGPGRTAFCDMRGTGPFSMGHLPCLVDNDGDGRFDEEFVGWLDSHFFSFVVQELSPLAKLAAPVAYRVATPPERPSVPVAYRVCDLGSSTSPPRFASVAKTGLEQGWSTVNTADCRFGVWPDAGDRTRLTVDAIELKIAAGPEPTFQVVKDLKPGRIGRFLPGGSLATAYERPDVRTELQGAIKTMVRSPIKDAGPATVTQGPVKSGKVILSVPARHAITGRLRNEVRAKGLFDRGAAPLPIGTPVYGARRLGSAVFWCAPTRTETPKGGKWKAICLPEAGGMTRWMPISGGLYPSMFMMISANTSGADTPSVDEQAVDFGPPMTVEYRFGGVSKRGELEMSVRLVTEDGGQDVSYVAPSLDPSGVALFHLMGGIVKLTPSPDRKSVTAEVVSPLEAKGRPLPF